MDDIIVPTSKRAKIHHAEINTNNNNDDDETQSSATTAPTTKVVTSTPPSTAPINTTTTNTRRLRSVFRSNQAIHDLTNSILESKRPRQPRPPPPPPPPLQLPPPKSPPPPQDKDGPIQIEPRSETSTSTTTTNNNNYHVTVLDDVEQTTSIPVPLLEDAEVVVLVQTKSSDTPQTNQQINHTTQTNTTIHTQTHNDNQDDDIQVTNSNTINPTIIYPHPRHLCGVHSFQNPLRHLIHCRNCYCYVCDCPAVHCTTWEGDHCHAHSGEDVWVRRRKQYKNTIVLDIGTTDDDEDDDDDDEDDDDEDEEEEEHDNIGREDEPQIRKSPLRVTTASSTTGISIAFSPTSSQDEKARKHTIRNPYNSSSSNTTTTTNNSNNIKRENPNVARRQTSSTLSSKTTTEPPPPPPPPSRESSFRPGNVRISEVLAYNLRSLELQTHESTKTASSSGGGSKIGGGGGSSSSNSTEIPITSKMEGDIPQLNLHPSFFIEGVRIGWPFPAIMPPQRQMALHLIKAFKNSRHVVLESPTGTGKSAAILCAALAWQRYDYKISGKMTKIVYCSRTHSQVAQMVSSLRKTPYRPRMAILGSRDRMCIHEDLTSKDRNGNRKKVNITTECRIRVKNTDKFRKRLFHSNSGYYDDDLPPESWPGDFDDGSNVEVDSVDDDAEDATAGAGGPQPRKNVKTCPHYRQLTASHTVEKAHAAFIPKKDQVSCCSLGGEKTKLGTHDIEDLVAFGKQPEVMRGVALYRNPTAGTNSFGLSLGQGKFSGSSSQRRNGTLIRDIAIDGAAAVEKSLAKGDMLLSCNGKNVHRKILSEITSEIRKTKDPLLLNVHRGEDSTSFDEDKYSSHAACPYYLSRALSTKADLVFAPYNYVLDPAIRSAMDINLQDSIVVLDEAHNVEDTLRQLGSGTFGEFDLCNVVAMLSNYASMVKCSENAIDQNMKWSNGNTADDKEKAYIPDVAHALLLFMDKIVEFLKESRESFETKPGPTGAQQAIAEYKRFKTPDNKKFEVFYYGPTGNGVNGKPIGCKMFFDKISFDKVDAESITTNVALFEQYMTARMGDASTRNLVVDQLVSFVSAFISAYTSPEHYYISSAVTVNGNFDNVAGDDGQNHSRRRFQKSPEAKVQYPPPNALQRHPRQIACSHAICRAKNRGRTYHATCCDGSTPKWEGHFVLNLLTPSILMKELTSMCRSVVLASGTLAPIPSLCAELNLLPKSSKPSTSSSNESDISFQSPDRLQITPKPLEANHVVNLEKQLLACAVGHFADGSPLCIKMANYNRPGFLEKLGDAIATIIEGIPHGGVLVFLPSFSLLRKCVSGWQDYNVWDRFLKSKGKVIVEPVGSQSEFEEARNEFNNTIRQTGNCILLAVFRGKMSEGVSFNDDYARGVICAGVPLPSFFDKAISSKIKYNNEQRKLRGRDLLPGNEWYQQQAYRAIAQAIGRCIRHAADYGTIILLDSRHCENHESRINSLGLCEVHQKLPKWMRHAVRTLRIDMRSSMGRNEILGGWQGLSREMKRFFSEAKVHGAGVLQKQMEDLKKVQNRDKNNSDLAFDRLTGKWTTVSTTQHELNAKVMRANERRKATLAATRTALTQLEVPHTNQRTESNANRKEKEVRIALDTHDRENHISITLDRVQNEVTNNIVPMVVDVDVEAENDAASKAATTSGISTTLDGMPIEDSNKIVSMAVNKGMDSSTITTSTITSGIRTTSDGMPNEAPNNFASMEVDTGVDNSAKSSGITPTKEIIRKSRITNFYPSPRNTSASAILPITDGLLASSTVIPLSLDVESSSPSQVVSPNRLQASTVEDSQPSSSMLDIHLCVICLERDKSILLLPCKHLCLCGKCFHANNLAECPICRTKIADHLDVFI